jgi:hypothetical protein
MKQLNFNAWVQHIDNELKKHYKKEKEKSVKSLSQYM